MITIAHMTERDGHLLSVGDYCTSPPTSQAAWEWEQTLRLYCLHDPQTVLEIGSDFGGTLKGWMLNATPGAVFVNIDDRAVDSETWQSWAQLRGSTLHTIRGDSRDGATIAAAQQYAPYDWIFIDADHSYDFVSLDWANYQSMVRPGGIVAFHDINERNGYGVSQLWREIQAQGYVTQEINAQLPSLCGVGVVYL